MDQPINRFSGPYEFLSNFHIEPDGKALEHRFQASKARAKHDADWVMAAPKPGEAKRRGRLVKCRAEWDLVRNDVMLRLLRTKFEREPYRTMLLATGNAHLTEGNTWHDQYWGNCTCPMHRAVDGENWLGKLLMQVREELEHGPTSNQTS